MRSSINNNYSDVYYLPFYKNNINVYACFFVNHTWGGNSSCHPTHWSKGTTVLPPIFQAMLWCPKQIPHVSHKPSPLLWCLFTSCPRSSLNLWIPMLPIHWSRGWGKITMRSNTSVTWTSGSPPIPSPPPVISSVVRFTTVWWRFPPSPVIVSFIVFTMNTVWWQVFTITVITI